MSFSKSTRFDPDEWVEIMDPETKSIFYANPTSGDCMWERPFRVRPKDPNGDWWELFDESNGLNYYYHTTSGVTDWNRPAKGTIIPLSVIQSALKTIKSHEMESTVAQAQEDTGANANAAPLSSLPSQSSNSGEANNNNPSSNLKLLPLHHKNSGASTSSSASNSRMMGVEHLYSNSNNSSNTGRVSGLYSNNHANANAPMSPLSNMSSNLSANNAMNQNQNVFDSPFSNADKIPPPVSNLSNSSNPKSTIAPIPPAISSSREHLKGSADNNNSFKNIPNLNHNHSSVSSINLTNGSHSQSTTSLEKSTSLGNNMISKPLGFDENAAKAMNPFNKSGGNINGGRSNKSVAAFKSEEERTGSVRSLPYDLKSEINQFQFDGFAKKYFSTHKRGIFRRKVPLEKLIVWSKDSLNQPLMTLNKNVHKEAIKSFKTIQRIMGDRSPPASNWKVTTGMSILLEMGVIKGELRDEIYVQICKQLTNNPSGESIARGWELMAVLSTAFPPSKNFEDYLKNFISSHFSVTTNKENVYAKYCMSKFIRICRTGPRGKVPSLAEIERAREAPFNPSVFGETLEDIMKMQEESYPNLKVPRILTFLTESILSLNGQQSEGIFRVPADSEKITELKLKIEKLKYDMGDIADPNVPAALLKFWLRDLAEPLIPADLYQSCIDGCEDLNRCCQIIDRLPEANREVVIYMIKFLQVIADPGNQQFTKMSVNNLAMVFAPNFLRCPSDNPQVIFENTKYEQMFLRTLIQSFVPVDLRA